MRRSAQPLESINTFMNTRVGTNRSQSALKGFTMLELMIVITIIFILASIGAGQYQKSVIRAREAVLKSDLHDMRKAIQDYTFDQEAAPNSLQDLADKKYLGDVPTDPITRNKDWNTNGCDTVLSPDQLPGGICDVHSASDQISPFEDTPYSSW
jgi:general secretion pathway protein G